MRVVPVTISSRPVYFEQGLEGASRHHFLADIALEKLLVLRDTVRAIDADLDVVVLDGLRSRQTQRALRERYISELQSNGIDPSTVALDDFVADPDSIFSHGTGGAVDVWLLRNGVEVDLGASYDEFSDRSAPDYFERYPAQDSEAKQKAAARGVLVNAARSAGFLVLETEFWHLEFGTIRWGIANGVEPVLTQIVSLPNIESTNVDLHAFSAWPVADSGVAPAFHSPGDRQRALAHETHDPYYVRSGSPIERQLLSQLAMVIEAPPGYVGALFPSGLSAASNVFRRLGLERIIIGYDTYYEVRASALDAARAHGIQIDTLPHPKSDNQLREILKKNESCRTLVWVDSPSNWLLLESDIEGLARIAHEYGALLAVDTSVAPCQRLFSSGLDLLAMSLSKYPSGGSTAGGVLFGHPAIMRSIQEGALLEGCVLAPEAASRILVGTMTLSDRMAAISPKVRRIAAFLEKISMVREVHTAEGSGQIVLHVTPDHGAQIEAIVAANAAVYGMPKLMCTFGAPVSSIEHFNTNPRFRSGIAADRNATGESSIPATAVRLSVGAEPVESIISALRFILSLGVSA